MKTVYTSFCTDVLHEGHMNIIREARQRGKVIVGALSDKALIRYNKFPTISQEDRVRLYRSIEGVEQVVIQDDAMYDDVITLIRPDYVVHGDNWREGPESAIRQHVADLLAQYGGEVVDIPYTYNEKVKKIDLQLREKLAMPEYRRKRLRQLIDMTPVVKAMEAHSGLTGLVVENTTVHENGGAKQFDAMWLSSLCDSTSRGKPDIELVDMTSRFRTIDDLMEVTTKPIIIDGDTGGLTEHFVYTVRSLERMGVSMVIIEDKTGLKKNSLFGTEVVQTQDSIENFCEKIKTGCQARRTKDFMICARIESLILEKGQEDALERARAFTKAGADAIMIHSRKKDPAEIIAFLEAFRKEDPSTPVVLVPTSFNSVKEEEWKQRGANIIIYANQLMRAAVPAIQQAAESILKNHRAEECDANLMPFKEIIRMIPEE